MVSAKKNLTVAALATLLAVPAFGATNASHALHIPSVAAHTAHADSTVSIPSSYTGHWSGRSNIGRWSVDLGRNSGYMHRYYPGDNEQGPIAYTQNSNGKYSWWPANAIGKAGAGPASSYFYLLPNGQLAWKEDVNTSYLHRDSSSEQSNNSSQNNNQATNNANSNTNTSNTSNNTNNVNTNTHQSNNNSTQYASKNSLPQTGESNGNAKAMALSAMALGASASFMALSISEKNRREAKLDSVSSEPTVDAGDGKSDGDDIYDAYYHKIMADTFASIREDFKKF